MKIFDYTPAEQPESEPESAIEPGARVRARGVEYVVGTPRPPECCGVCPETVSGGYDCTCRGNPRCPNDWRNRTKAAWGEFVHAVLDTPVARWFERVADRLGRLVERISGGDGA